MKKHGVWPTTRLRALESQRGAAAVEFAIVCSLLFLLIFGIIEFSIILYDKAMLTNASREGARAGIVFAPDRDTTSVTGLVTDAVNEYLPNLINFGTASPISTTITIEGGGATVSPGQALTVNLSYTYNFLVFPPLASLFGGSFGPSLNLEAQTIMRME